MTWQQVVGHQLKMDTDAGAAITISNGVTPPEIPVIWQDSLESPAIQSMSSSNGGGGSKRSSGSGQADDEDVDDNNNSNNKSSKKARVSWTPELHNKFVEAINIIEKRKKPDHRFGVYESGDVRAVPKDILEEMKKMGETDLTGQNISSHLQKFRSMIRQQGEYSGQQQSGPSFSSPPTQCYPLPINLISSIRQQGKYSGQQQPGPSFSSPLSQCYPLPSNSISSAPPLSTTTYHHPAAIHPHYSPNLAANFRGPTLPNRYFPGTGQQLGPFPFGPILHHHRLPHSHMNHPPNFSNPSPRHVNISAARANMWSGPRPASVYANQTNQLIFQAPRPVNQLTFPPVATLDHPCRFSAPAGPSLYGDRSVPSVPANRHHEEPAPEAARNINRVPTVSPGQTSNNFDVPNFAGSTSLDEFDIGDFNFECPDLSCLYKPCSSGNANADSFTSLTNNNSVPPN